MQHARRYPAIDGVAAWRIPIVAVAFVAAAAAVADWSIIAAIGVVALIAEVLERAVVFEVSTVGLVRAVVVGDALVGPARVIPWTAVAEVTTRWRGPGDFTVLETIIVGRHGDHLTFGSRMGLGAYRRLLAEVVRHAPQARRTGLTDELLAESAVVLIR
jgi:hypothetical protein